jgi:hypothetical protein
LSRREADVRFLGTAIFLSPFVKSLQKLPAEHRLPRGGLLTIALDLILVGSAHRAEALAAGRAKRLHRKVQYNFVSYHLTQVADAVFHRENLYLVPVVMRPVLRTLHKLGFAIKVHFFGEGGKTPRTNQPYRAFGMGINIHAVADGRGHSTDSEDARTLSFIRKTGIAHLTFYLEGHSGTRSLQDLGYVNLHLDPPSKAQ